MSFSCFFKAAKEAEAAKVMADRPGTLHGVGKISPKDFWISTQSVDFSCLSLCFLFCPGARKFCNCRDLTAVLQPPQHFGGPKGRPKCHLRTSAAGDLNMSWFSMSWPKKHAEEQGKGLITEPLISSMEAENQTHRCLKLYSTTSTDHSGTPEFGDSLVQPETH